jgi:hypothetical protein
MVYFTPREGYKQTVVDRYHENPYRVSPTQLRQVWSGMARDGQEVTFTTILLPHSPVLAPKELLTPPADSKDRPRIEVITDTENLTVVKVIYVTDPMNNTQYETHVMLNTTGKPAKAGLLESDGMVAVIGLTPQGAILHRAVAGGTQLRFKDADQSATARKLPLNPLTAPAEYRK